MNSSNAIVDRFVDFSHYLRSSEFRINPKANIFTPLRKVSSVPAANNYLPLANELKFEIAKYLSLKDFAAFSSINVDNYLSLRSDDLLVEKVIKKEPRVRMFDILDDLKHRAQQFDIDAEIEVSNLNAVIPPIALSSGPAQLIFRGNPRYYTPHSFDFVRLFRKLCILAEDDSIDDLSKAKICTLLIDLNNRMGLKIRGGYSFANALCHLGIALYENRVANLDDRLNDFATLANMIENGLPSSEFHRELVNAVTKKT